jgi:hypothetical protein
MRERMGANKRYAERVDRQMGQRADEAATRGLAPTSLTDAELELDLLPLTKTPKPHEVRAWVRYGAVAVKVTARAMKWTPRAVALEWEAPSGEIQRAWVWASAVEAADSGRLSRP